MTRLHQDGLPAWKNCAPSTAQLEADYSNLEDYSGKNGCTLKRWNFELEMVPSGASSEFTVYYGGEKRGTQNVAIDFE